MAPLTALAFAAVIVCFFLWWRARTTVTAGMALVALAALVAILIFLFAAPHPAAN